MLNHFIHWWQSWTWKRAVASRQVEGRDWVFASHSFSKSHLSVSKKDKARAGRLLGGNQWPWPLGITTLGSFLRWSVGWAHWSASRRNRTWLDYKKMMASTLGPRSRCLTQLLWGKPAPLSWIVLWRGPCGTTARRNWGLRPVVGEGLTSANSQRHKFAGRFLASWVFIWDHDWGPKLHATSRDTVSHRPPAKLHPGSWPPENARQ